MFPSGGSCSFCTLPMAGKIHNVNTINLPNVVSGRYPLVANVISVPYLIRIARMAPILTDETED
jgi:hypothetical protein